MDFAEVLEKVLDLLQRQGRVSYRALKLRFQLDEEFLAGIKEELLFTHAEQVKEEGPGLVWVGKEQGAGSEEQRAKGKDSLESSVQSPVSEEQGRAVPVQTLAPRHQTLDAAAERRQLTVMFCDLVGSTALSTQLDPEELREVILAYRETCATVIRRFEGYLAKYIGDGLLVYFGYPVAHEDDAQRAVRVGLGIVDALQELSLPRVQLPRPLQVRIGIHTGLVVAGEMGVADQPEPLAIVGETPNVAARIQGLAEANTVIVSAATHRLIDGTFECQPFGSHLLKGIATPVAVYHVQSERQNLSPLASRTTLTPLVGREQEVGLLVDRWEQVKEGRGQVVLLSGEPGIGKSRLAYTLREHVTAEGSLLFESRCSSYYQHSAFYPLIDVLQRTLLLRQQDTDSEKVGKLERALVLYNMQETLPLFASLLSLPAPRSSLPAFSPQKQKERTLQVLLQLHERAGVGQSSAGFFRTRPARTHAAPCRGRTADGHQRLCSSGGGKDLRSCARAVPANGRNPATVLRALRLVGVLSSARRVSDRARARERATRPSADSARLGASPDSALGARRNLASYGRVCGMPRAPRGGDSSV